MPGRGAAPVLPKAPHAPPPPTWRPNASCGGGASGPASLLPSATHLTSQQPGPGLGHTQPPPRRQLLRGAGEEPGSPESQGGHLSGLQLPAGLHSCQSWGLPPHLPAGPKGQHLSPPPPKKQVCLASLAGRVRGAALPPSPWQRSSIVGSVAACTGGGGGGGRWVPPPVAAPHSPAALLCPPRSGLSTRSCQGE